MIRDYNYNVENGECRWYIGVFETKRCNKYDVNNIQKLFLLGYL